MKTYAALASSKEKYHLRALRETNYPYVLVSYAYDKSATWFDKLAYDFRGMLDSGAFSVRTKGLEVDLDAYIAWALLYAAKYPNVRVTNLDVIPGLRPSKRERDKAVTESADNAARIRAAGLRVVEVHHLADPLSSLEAMIGRRQPGEVIGVAGLGGAGLTDGGKNKDLGRAFGDGVFACLRDLCGWGHFPPIHGFGVSVQSVLFRYPLASVDASSWVAPDRFGTVLHRNGTAKRGNSLHLRNSNVATAEGKRILDSWQRRDLELQGFWRDRGVVIEEEGAALVSE